LLRHFIDRYLANPQKAAEKLVPYLMMRSARFAPKVSLSAAFADLLVPEVLRALPPSVLGLFLHVRFAAEADSPPKVLVEREEDVGDEADRSIEALRWFTDVEADQCTMLGPLKDCFAFRAREAYLANLRDTARLDGLFYVFDGGDEIVGTAGVQVATVHNKTLSDFVGGSTPADAFLDKRGSPMRGREEYERLWADLAAHGRAQFRLRVFVSLVPFRSSVVARVVEYNAMHEHDAILLCEFPAQVRGAGDRTNATWTTWRNATLGANQIAPATLLCRAEEVRLGRIPDGATYIADSPSVSFDPQTPRDDTA
jgi:hypothetical protein